MQTVAIGSIWARRGPTLIKNIRERSRRSLVNIPKDHFASYLKLIAIVKARRVNKTASNFGQEPARRFYVKEAYFRLHLANKCTELVLSLMHPQSAFTFPAFVFLLKGYWLRSRFHGREREFVGKKFAYLKGNRAPEGYSVDAPSSKSPLFAGNFVPFCKQIAQRPYVFFIFFTYCDKI